MQTQRRPKKRQYELATAARRHHQSKSFNSMFSHTVEDALLSNF